MALLSLKDVDVSYDNNAKVLQKMCIDIEEGNLVSFLGPSGCGKTTALRVIAGFIQPSAGSVMFDNQDYTRIPVHKRNFGVVFQSYALFPHLTVFDNVAFGLRAKRMGTKEAIKTQVETMLEAVDLGDLAKRYPKELSGGQRQRVAIARALAVKPRLLLLDEPLSNLDAKLRLKMRVEIRRLQMRSGITTIFVTHDQEECFSISDRVAIMNKGVMEQYDSPEKIYAHPATEFAARFVGFENFFDAVPQGNGLWHTAAGTMRIAAEPVNKEKPVKAAIRPGDILIDTAKTAAENTVDGIVLVRTYIGQYYQYRADTPLGELTVNGNRDTVFNEQDRIRLHFSPEHIILI
ncbi:MAG: ABC transporter ATP-binding protein [Spirochaetaceae bacterium]|jgi:putative spermidine/putrescine transport system ATP-binding protein|nr:ABC transporter ATP-binding protein [Spirochaetaceae bacterium]